MTDFATRLAAHYAHLESITAGMITAGEPVEFCEGCDRAVSEGGMHSYPDHGISFCVVCVWESERYMRFGDSRPDFDDMEDIAEQVAAERSKKESL